MESKTLNMKFPLIKPMGYGDRETVEVASSYVKDSGYSFDVYYDTEIEAASAYNVYSVPTTYFIDKDGHIVTHAKGAIDRSTLEKGIKLIYP